MIRTRFFAFSRELVLVSGIAPKTACTLPLYLSPVAAGFPSPADDFLEGRLDLNEHLIKNPTATYLVKVTGNSMRDVGIFSGDTLVVDKSIQADDGKIVIAVVFGEFTVKTLRVRNAKTSLVPANGTYPEIEVTPEMDCEIWGVVTSVIRKLF
ncbi:DNA polymerase V [Desulfonatronum thiosulfatophilum]|uniref:DNA polymerase V n=1 Tax=Desulfonatronum thiosulfatophilum TaxID=617002 RepID=A0A1G6ESQ0_9BACT|nr:translesion error-prone DNA polymerase V autoproteolytic subunit [Desulfonatronum thiosulfatophilum]SDB60484.1 DNA polymerase V [Desulfonatronum thiosulfatophilum]